MPLQIAIILFRRIIMGWLIGQLLNSTIRQGLLKRQFDWLEEEVRDIAVWLHLQPAL